MLSLIKKNLVEPLAGRLGSLAAGSLVTIGIADPHANAIGYGVSAVILVAMDLVTRWLMQRERSRNPK